MYESFFGLAARPFAITPAVDMFFESAAHRLALSYLRHGVLEGHSFIVLTGEIGAGKTTLLRTLLRDLPDEAVVPAVLVSSRLDAVELTEAILWAFGARTSGAASPADLEAALQARLADLGRSGRRGLVIVDEAQNLSAEALRHLMHLAAPDAAGKAIPLQVVAAGQPGLQTLLAETAADAVCQPVFVSCRLGSMDAAETAAYIRHRLEKAGSSGSPSFSPEACELIHTASRGIPRRINRLCERLLVGACLAGRHDIDADSVPLADAQLRDELGMPGASTLSPDVFTDAGERGQAQWLSVETGAPPVDSAPVDMPPAEKPVETPVEKAPVETPVASMPAATPFEAPPDEALARESMPVDRDDARPDDDPQSAARRAPRRAPRAAMVLALIVALVSVVGFWIGTDHGRSPLPRSVAPESAAPVPSPGSRGKAGVVEDEAAAPPVLPAASAAAPVLSEAPAAAPVLSEARNEGRERPQAAAASAPVVRPGVIDPAATLGLGPPEGSDSAASAAARSCSDAVDALGLCP